MTAALNALLIILPIWLVNQIHLPSTFGVRGLNAMNVIVILTLAVLMLVRYPKSAPPPMRGAILFFFFALAYGYSIGLLYDRSQYVTDFVVLKTGVFYISLYFLFYYGVRDLRMVRIVTGVILMVAFVAGLEAMREALNYGLSAYSETKRAAGPFGADYRASNLAAVFFAIFLPLFAAIGLFLKNSPIVRFAAIAGVAVLLFAIFFTYSRQAYAIVAIVVLLMALRKNLFVALLLSLALWNYELWVPDSAVERVQMTTEVSEDQFEGKSSIGVDYSTSSRWDLWVGGARMLQENPLGVGLNHWKREIGKYTDYYVNLDAHNFYVLITAEAGVVGGLAIAWLLFALFRFAYRNLRLAQTPGARTLAFGFMGATIALAMGNLYGSRFLNGEVVGNYWIFAALCARYFQLLREGAMGEQAAMEAARALQERSIDDARLPNGRRAPAMAREEYKEYKDDEQPELRPASREVSRDQNGRLIRS